MFEFTAAWGTSFNLVDPVKTRLNKKPYILAHLGTQNWSSKTVYVSSSAAHNGFGPLIYDLAMSHCTKKGIGLTSDRTQTSPSAMRVWFYYYKHRTDVVKLPFDSKRFHKYGEFHYELNHEYKLKIPLDVSELILNGERLQKELGFTKEDVVIEGSKYFTRNQRR